MSLRDREIRALIVDDNPKFRLELRGLLELEDIHVVGEAGNGWEAVELTQSLDPDIVLMDQNMPALSGIDATRRIKHNHHHPRVIFVAAEEIWRDEALKAGADGYFVKGERFETLISAIRNAEIARMLLSTNESSSLGPPARRPLRGVWVLIGLVLLTTTYVSRPDLFPAAALVVVAVSLVLYLQGSG
jgi:two-component system nitrate/nitrite response regulator NarL